MASGLLNMSVDMIMKMNESSTTNMTDSVNKHSMEKMTSMTDNQSTSNEGNQENKIVKNLSNYETSVAQAKSLKILFTNYLKDSKFENSTGLMPIPTGMKINAIRELGQGIDNLVLALNRNASVEEVYSIVHGQIHPNLFLAFSLKLKSD
jgi:CRISPR/Cas system-associated endonuclease Cas3-HD